MSEPANLAPSAADALPLPPMRPTTQGDPAVTAEPTHNHFAYRYAVCGAELRTLKPTPGLPDCEECAQMMTEMEAREASERPADAPTCQDTPDTTQPATEAHSAADTHDLIERAAHLARLGWAVEKLKAQGAVEFTLTQIEDAARALEKGGDSA